MEQILIYLLKVNGLLIFFWIFYKLLLQKETFYTFNRFYFLVSALMSFVLPLIYFTKIKEIIVPVPNLQVVENYSTNLNQAQEIIQLKWHDTIDWFLVITLLITLISLTKVGIRIFKIIQLTNSIKRLDKHVTEKNIRISENEEQVYSFYKWIVLPKKLLNSENYTILIKHEKVHIKQKHSFDLVSLTFICDFFWFNPFIKWIIKDVNLNLEFLVDDEITKQENSYLYQKTLLNFNQNQTQNIITNAFNSTDLKQRILMINTKKSNNMKKLKIALTAPALLLFFGLFQIETIAQVKTEKIKNDKKENSLISNKPLYLVDDKEISEADFRKISPDVIKSIEVVNDDLLVEIYGEKAKDGLIIIKTIEVAKEDQNIIIEKRKAKTEKKNLSLKENKKSKSEKRKAIIEERKALTEKQKSAIENKRTEIERQKAILEERKALTEKRNATIEKTKIENEKQRAVAEEKKAKIESKKAEIEKQHLNNSEKDFNTISSIFIDLKKETEKLENDDFKITSISASITQEDGNKITISEKY